MLRQWLDAGLLRDIDVQFAALIARLADRSEDSLPAVSAALTSRAVGQGHSCLDVAPLAGKVWPECERQKTEVPATAETELPSLTFPSTEAWRAKLQCTALEGIIGAGAETPLVLSPDGRRLYLAKYWQYEQDVVCGLLDRAQMQIPEPMAATELSRRLAELFPDASDETPDRQKLAAAIACRQRLAIISGGPGTGKTYVAARILALLIEHAISRRGGIPPRILLTAPTGKAAARMREAIITARSDPALVSEEMRALIPAEALTLHRMLGYSPQRGRFRHDVRNPLPADVVVIDEASMVALPLMAGLIRALPRETSLILLGDMNQLASVEPGYVLGDICEAADIERFSPEAARDFHAATGIPLPPESVSDGSSPLADASVELQISRRFPPESPVARLTDAINSAGATNGPERALAVLHSLASDPASGILHRTTPHSLVDATGKPHRHIRELLSERFRGFLNATDPAEAFAEFATFRILCAVRRGPNGVATLNAITEQILSLGGRRGRSRSGNTGTGAPATGEPFYDHRPVLISENDYSLGLFNGDIGICLAKKTPSGNTTLRVHFQTPDGGIRDIALAALPAHETAFAMTVHKAQGSEFGNVLLVVPAHDSEVVSRELLYTAASRTRRGLEIWCPDARFLDAVRRRGWRQSGLVDALRDPKTWNPPA